MLLPAHFAGLYLSSPGTGRAAGWAAQSPARPPTFTRSTAISKSPWAGTISVNFLTPFGCTKPPRSSGVCGRLLRGERGPFLRSPCASTGGPAASSPSEPLGSRRGSRGAGASRERVGVRMNNDDAAALGSCTTDSQHRNYSRHKENTNKDHTQQRKAGISQQKRRIETLKAAFISLCSSVHGQSSTRNVRAQGTLQVIRISSFIAYFLYKLTTNTGVLILFVLFGNSETE